MPVGMPRNGQEEQIKTFILSKIESGQYKPDDRLPSESELCKVFQTTRFTVRKAISDLIYNQIVYQIPSKGTFVAGRTGEAHLIAGVVIPSGITNPFMGRIIASLDRELSKQHISIQLAYSNNEQRIEEDRLAQLVNNGAKGLVIWTSDCRSEEKNIDIYSELGVPLVFIDRYMSEVAGDKVVGRDRESGIEGARHLIEHGRTRIGFFNSDRAVMSPARERLAGIRAALDEAGLPFESNRVVECIPMRPDVSYQELFDLEKDKIHEYLKGNPDLDGVLTINEQVAAKFYIACRELEIKIPEDLAIIAFSDSDLCQFVYPQLTTFDQNPELIGKHAADLLSAKMLGLAVSHDLFVRVGYKLIVRESCGCK